MLTVTYIIPDSLAKFRNIYVKSRVINWKLLRKKAYINLGNLMIIPFGFACQEISDGSVIKMNVSETLNVLSMSKRSWVQTPVIKLGVHGHLSKSDLNKDYHIICNYTRIGPGTSDKCCPLAITDTVFPCFDACLK